MEGPTSEDSEYFTGQYFAIGYKVEFCTYMGTFLLTCNNKCISLGYMKLCLLPYSTV